MPVVPIGTGMPGTPTGAAAPGWMPAAPERAAPPMVVPRIVVPVVAAPADPARAAPVAVVPVRPIPVIPPLFGRWAFAMLEPSTSPRTANELVSLSISFPSTHMMLRLTQTRLILWVYRRFPKARYHHAQAQFCDVSSIYNKSGCSPKVA